ncbi:HAD-IIIA family hydrolase, partial [Rhodoplanes sp. TEM]
LFDLDLARLAAAHAAHAAALTVVAQPTLRPRESDLLAERDGRLAAVFPKDRPDPQDQRNLSPAGLWLAGPGALPGRGGEPWRDLCRDVVPALLAAGRPVAVHRTTEYLARVDAAAARAAAERDLAAGRPEALRLAHRRPALLVDVDGVLNHDPGPQGTLAPDDIVMVDGAGAALARARAAGFVIAAITNRAQVARGDVSFEALDRILGRLEALLAADGGYLDHIYVCPHHPGPFPHGGVPELVRACECRKPGTLLFRRAFAELPIDPGRACMVGDSTRDIMAAHAVGIPGYGVMTGHGCRDTGRARDGLDGTPDRMFADIGAAVDVVLAQA